MVSASKTDNLRKGNALRGIILFLFTATAVFTGLLFLYSEQFGFIRRTPLYYLSGIACIFLLFFISAPLLRYLSFLLPDHPARIILAGFAAAFLCLLLIPFTPLKEIMGKDIPPASIPGCGRDNRKLMLMIAAEGCSDTFRIIAEDSTQTFHQYYSYTIENFERCRYAGLLAVLPPDDMTDADRASVLAALNHVFNKVIVVKISSKLVFLSSDDQRLTDDWNELEGRARLSGAYSYAGLPESLCLLNVVYPLFQDQTEIREIQERAAEAEAFSIRNISFHQYPMEFLFIRYQNHFILIFAGLLVLYAFLRYWLGGTGVRKQGFRLFETGFFYTGLLMIVFFKFFPSVYCSETGFPEQFFLFCFLFFALAALFPPRKEFLSGQIFILIVLFCVLFLLKQPSLWPLIFLITVSASHVQSRLTYAGQAAPSTLLRTRHLFAGIGASILISTAAIESGFAGFWMWGMVLLLLPFLRHYGPASKGV